MESIVASTSNDPLAVDRMSSNCPNGLRRPSVTCIADPSYDQMSFADYPATWSVVYKDLATDVGANDRVGNTLPGCSEWNILCHSIV